MHAFTVLRFNGGAKHLSRSMGLENGLVNTVRQLLGVTWAGDLARPQLDRRRFNNGQRPAHLARNSRGNRCTLGQKL